MLNNLRYRIKLLRSRIAERFERFIMTPEEAAAAIIDSLDASARMQIAHGSYSLARYAALQLALRGHAREAHILETARLLVEYAETEKEVW